MIHDFIRFPGIFLLMGIAWLFSTDRRRIDYQKFVKTIATGGLKHSLSLIIEVCVLYGFARPAFVAIFVDGTSAVAPARTKTLSHAGFRALCATRLGCPIIACSAGSRFTDNSIFPGR